MRTLYWFSAPLGTEETSAKIKNSSGSNDDESNDGLQPATATDYRSSAESSEAAGAAARGEHNDDDIDPCTPEIIQLSETTVPIDIETEIVIKEQAMTSEECRDDDGDVKKNNKSSISTFYMVSNEGDGDICCVVCKDDDGLLNGQGATTCDICMVGYETGDVLAWSRNAQCRHYFYETCVMDWLMRQPTCPACRRNYLVDEPVPPTTSARFENDENV